ncbi:MAG: DNA-directed RNA polymerase subunit alpha [Candidatus Dormibacteraceae bacterium]
MDTRLDVSPTARKIEGDDTYGKFEIEPLGPGVGTTLGNALRRQLLSSLQGAAVTSIQVEGVAHEFASIAHVKEDVSELILNLKQLRLKSFSPELVTLRLDIRGPAEVHASDIQLPDEVEVINGDLYICTLADGGQLRMELNVEQGKGYAPAELNKREGQAIGVISIDAIFSPVVKANFLVEKTRVGQSTDFERLHLEVWTDGTLTPEDAVSGSARQFTQHLDLFSQFGASIQAHEEQVIAQQAQVGLPPEIPVEELDLSVRAYNCLKANDITTIRELLTKKEDELLSLRNFGKKSLDEIREKLVEKGFVEPDQMDSVFS